MLYTINGSQLAKVRYHLVTLHMLEVQTPEHKEKYGTLDEHSRCKCSTKRLYRAMMDLPIQKRYEG